jgi:cytochrome c oxidase cbb3-type subunit III
MKNQIKYSALVCLAMVMSTAVSAQETANAALNSVKSQEFNHVFQWILLGAIALLVGATAFISMRVMKMYQDIVLTAIAKEEGRDVINIIKEKAAKKTVFDVLKFRLFGTGAVAIEKEQDIMIEHPHDGIYELDNQLPPWWVSMFYATIVFAVVYFAYYHYFDIGKGQIEEYKEEMRKGDILKAQEAERQANLVNENSVVALTDKVALEQGKEIFIGKCAACHGQKGEGGVGPNMTDDYWLHGGDIKKVFTVVKNGVPEKGMIAWKDQLRAVDMQNVSSYILTLRGTNPPNPKAPQGEKYVPEGFGALPSAAVDSTKKQ